MGGEGLDPDWCVEFLTDLVFEKGVKVFSLDWDSGGPGAGAGTEEVYQCFNRFWPCSGTFGLSDPCETLGEALKGDIGAITDATTEVWCSPLAPAEIAKLLHVCGKPPFSFTINGEPWRVSKAGVIEPDV